MTRILSLIASSTEIICALGFEKDLVGRSHECDFPASIRSLPACSETKFIADGKSYEIDARIKAILQEGLSVYRVHAEKLRELQPDVIVTQIQCEVCAVSARDVEAAVCDWMDAGGVKRPKIVSLNPNCLEDIWADVRRIASALSAGARGEALISDLKTRIDLLSRLAHSAPERPRVACIEWIEPLMSAGNWVPELVELAGGINLFGEAGKHSPWMSFEELRLADPDRILILPCGFDIARIREETHLLTTLPGWTDLRAVHANHVYVADGNQYFNRPGPRVVESLEILLEIFHPSLGLNRLNGSGWQRL